MSCAWLRKTEPCTQYTQCVYLCKSISTYLALPLSGTPQYCFHRMKPTLANLFRDRLRHLRDARGLTQEDLEARIGKVDEGTGYISRVETGRIGTPPFEVIEKLATALEVQPLEFFFTEGLDESADALIARINSLLADKDPDQIRTIYRLMLVYFEKY
jgi:transcriptional regulator with XRE-family HTH domain